MVTVDVQTLLLVAAEAREFAGLVRHCRQVTRLPWPLRFAREAELNGRRLILVAHGAGPALAGEACDVAWSRAKADAIISTGFCGALDPSLGPGEVFVATRVATPQGPDGLEAQSLDCARSHASGRLLSVNHVVQTAEEKRTLHLLGASAVEMEAAAVGSRAAGWGVPFYCVRGVTDLARESFHLDFNGLRDSDGRLSGGRIAWAAARRPKALVPEVYNLYRRSWLAARAIGDFLADCRF
jgi:adenosylhomocysteine nucleosidase